MTLDKMGLKSGDKIRNDRTGFIRTIDHVGSVGINCTDGYFIAYANNWSHYSKLEKKMTLDQAKIGTVWIDDDGSEAVLISKDGSGVSAKSVFRYEDGTTDFQEYYVSNPCENLQVYKPQEKPEIEVGSIWVDRLGGKWEFVTKYKGKSIFIGESEELMYQIGEPREFFVKPYVENVVPKVGETWYDQDREVEVIGVFEDGKYCFVTWRYKNRPETAFCYNLEIFLRYMKKEKSNA